MRLLFNHYYFSDRGVLFYGSYSVSTGSFRFVSFARSNRFAISRFESPSAFACFVSVHFKFWSQENHYLLFIRFRIRTFLPCLHAQTCFKNAQKGRLKNRGDGLEKCCVPSFLLARSRRIPIQACFCVTTLPVPV